jgi:TatD DNase family protein
MRLIDTHTHLYLPEFEKDFDEVLDRARKAGVTRFYLPAIDNSAIPAMLKMAALYPSEFFPMVGVHPSSVKEDFLGELKVRGRIFIEEKICGCWGDRARLLLGYNF